MILNENDIIDSWLNNNDIGRAIFEDPNPIRIYNEWCAHYDVDSKIDVIAENTSENYIQDCTNNWYMPEEYKALNLESYLRTMLCEKTGCKEFHIETMPEWDRAYQELQEFEKRGMTKLLQFLIYLVDVCKENNVVLGVGRGSSVASYVLYLIGIHKVDSAKYDLDIKEFLK